MRGKLNTNNFNVRLVAQHRLFKTGENLNSTSCIEINLDVARYIVADSSKLNSYEKSYNEQLTDEEIKTLIKFESKKHKEFIERQIMKLENQ